MTEKFDISQWQWAEKHAAFLKGSGHTEVEIREKRVSK